MSVCLCGVAEERDWPVCPVEGCAAVQKGSDRQHTKKHCQVMLGTCFVVLASSDFLHFILIIGYAAKIVPGCDSISLKMFPAL